MVLASLAVVGKGRSLGAEPGARGLEIGWEGFLASVEPEFRLGFDGCGLPPSGVLTFSGTGLGDEGGDWKPERPTLGRDISDATNLRSVVPMTPPVRGFGCDREAVKTQGSGYGPHHGGHIRATG